MGVKVLDRLFSLRLALREGVRVEVRAFDMAQFDTETGKRITSETHHAITYEVVLFQNGGREVVWSPGQSWVGMPGHQTIDGRAAKEAILHAVSMKPGDTDEDFFADWTGAQRSFGETWGEEIGLISEERFGAK